MIKAPRAPHREGGAGPIEDAGGCRVPELAEPGQGEFREGPVAPEAILLLFRHGKEQLVILAVREGFLDGGF